MFRRFVRPHCKNLNTLCTFLIMLWSSKSGVTLSWCRQIWDVWGNTFFTCWRSASNWNSMELVAENSKWDAPSPLSVNWLNYTFSFWETSEVDFNGKKTEKWLGIPSNWSLKIQNEMPSPLSMNWADLYF